MCESVRESLYLTSEEKKSFYLINFIKFFSGKKKRGGIKACEDIESAFCNHLEGEEDFPFLPLSLTHNHTHTHALSLSPSLSRFSVSHGEWRVNHNVGCMDGET